MKDYYYFLGLQENASDEDIRKAYRKLSVKYHPDKNENDAFFVDRFREVQEAYETLIDHERRRIYDQNLGNQQRSNRSQVAPFIKTFTSNKIRAHKGEEIIIKWQTSNADVVKILPFGLEKAYGERVFKITEFKDGKFHVVLQAMNTLINKTVVQGITITEVSEINSESIKKNAEEFMNNRKDIQESPQSSIIFKILIALMCLGLIVYLISRFF